MSCSALLLSCSYIKKCFFKLLVTTSVLLVWGVIWEPVYSFIHSLYAVSESISSCTSPSCMVLGVSNNFKKLFIFHAAWSVHWEIFLLAFLLSSFFPLIFFQSLTKFCSFFPLMTPFFFTVLLSFHCLDIWLSIAGLNYVEYLKFVKVSNLIQSSGKKAGNELSFTLGVCSLKWDCKPMYRLFLAQTYSHHELYF